MKQDYIFFKNARFDLHASNKFQKSWDRADKDGRSCVRKKNK